MNIKSKYLPPIQLTFYKCWQLWAQGCLVGICCSTWDCGWNKPK